MLKKFKVNNFKCFGSEFLFDLSTAKNYTFNPECIKNGIVNNAMIYGYNGTGKSNLGWAIFDIIEHLTDKTKIEFPYKHYTNAQTINNVAEFEYEFLINGDIVVYRYSKTDYKTLVTEQLFVNGKEIVYFDRRNDNTVFTCNMSGTET